jgi:diguanylate cyclase (GGDEF)-like protein
VRRATSYPLIGVLLGLGSPAGALALRWLAAGRAWPPLPWVAAELEAQALFYVYNTVGTVTAFALAGWIAGLSADRLAELSRRLAELSLHDPLTGLLNRRALDDRLKEEIARALRAKRPMSCLMADLDHFKALNDRLGHRAGDEMLRELAALLRGIVRSDDVLGRYGGEEFLIILHGAVEAGAVRIAEGIRSAVAQHAFDAGGVQAQFTVSLGVAQRDPGDVTGAAMVEAADRAMYAAKADGRNRVMAASNVPRNP